MCACVCVWVVLHCSRSDTGFLSYVDAKTSKKDISQLLEEQKKRCERESEGGSTCHHLTPRTL